MKRWISVMVIGLMAITQAGSSFSQEIPGAGFSVLLCVAEQTGGGPGNSQVSISINSDTGPDADGIGQAEVTITHGKSQSTHIVTYEDSNDTGSLDCGDNILSVV
jgi:hypothetical protein